MRRHQYLRKVPRISRGHDHAGLFGLGAGYGLGLSRRSTGARRDYCIKTQYNYPHALLPLLAPRSDAQPMSQQALFAPERISLVDDLEGGIHYLPSCLDPDIAQAWFALALNNAQWNVQQRIMYEREVMVPRLMSNFAYDSKDLPAPLVDAFKLVRELVGAPFNRVGLNLYRDGNDSVAPHGDKTDKLAPSQPIAILSLGATRRMSIRSKGSAAKTIHIDLEAGSCLVMSYAAQHTHEHGIPKAKSAVEPRISLAFRCYA